MPTHEDRFPAAGTAASLAANIATADDGMISRVIAGWPALALLIAVKLLSGILEHRTQAASSSGDIRAEGPARPSTLRAVPGGRAVRADRPIGRVPAKTIPGDGAALEQAARVVRDELHRDGQPLTRDALAIRLRAAGYAVRNARLATLLAALRAEPGPAA
jgi:hypothetical protein